MNGQVSAVSDQIGMEDMGVHPGELDDDEGGGLVFIMNFSPQCPFYMTATLIQHFSSLSAVHV